MSDRDLVRTFRAADPRAALDAVKAALGAEAVIVDTREVGGLWGRSEIEVTAMRSMPERAERPRDAAPSAPAAATPGLQSEIGALRRVVDELRAAPVVERPGRGQPARRRPMPPEAVTLCRQLVRRGVDSRLAEELVQEAHARVQLRPRRRAAAASSWRTWSAASSAGGWRAPGPLGSASGPAGDRAGRADRGRENHHHRQDRRPGHAGVPATGRADNRRYLPYRCLRAPRTVRRNHGGEDASGARRHLAGGGGRPRRRRPGADRQRRPVRRRDHRQPDGPAARGAGRRDAPGAVGRLRRARDRRGGAPLPRARRAAPDLHQAGRGRRPGQRAVGGRQPCPARSPA